VIADALPRSPAGKLRRPAVAELAARLSAPGAALADAAP
jgi:hypothetical protein